MLPLMRTLHLVLYILAAICFVAAILIPDATRVERDVNTGSVVGTTVTTAITRRLQLVAGGLAIWLLNPIISIINDMVND